MEIGLSVRGEQEEWYSWVLSVPFRQKEGELGAEIRSISEQGQNKAIYTSK